MSKDQGECDVWESFLESPGVVRARRTLCGLCVEIAINHRDAKNGEVAQRRMLGKCTRAYSFALIRLSLITTKSLNRGHASASCGH